jgi:hypothetical protein
MSSADSPRRIIRNIQMLLAAGGLGAERQTIATGRGLPGARNRAGTDAVGHGEEVKLLAAERNEWLNCSAILCQVTYRS